jgi:nicotinamide mononucleotide (NMN) deamidase PncC
VGMVYIGISQNNKTEARQFNFGAERERNRERAVYSALDMIRRAILGLDQK